jgi:hypothetical protein
MTFQIPVCGCSQSRLRKLFVLDQSMPSGLFNCPSAAPGEPNEVMKLPSLSNFLTLCADSVTYTLSKLSTIIPTGDTNWLSLEPSDPHCFYVDTIFGKFLNTMVICICYVQISLCIRRY